MAKRFISDDQMAQLDSQEPTREKKFISDTEMEALDQSQESGPTKTESLVRGAAQGATLGFADEISGGVESLWEKAKGNPTEFGKLYKKHRDESRANFKQAQEENPKSYMTGEIGGGLATAVIPGLNVAKGGATLAKAVDQGARLGALAATGYSEANNMKDYAKDLTLGTATGAVLPIAVTKGLQGAQKIAQKGAKALVDHSYLPKPKLNAREIKEAADRLGIKVTPAMMDDSEFVARLEYSLANSPSFLGQKVSRATKRVQEGLTSKADEVLSDASNLSDFQLGEKFKSGVTSKVGERLDPISTVFNEVRESTKTIPIGDKSKEAVIRNIEKLDSYDLMGGEGLPGKYVDRISRLKNADQVKSLMTMLNQDIKGSMGAEKGVLIEIKQKLSTLEKNSITRAAVQVAREGGMKSETGKTIGKEIINDLKDARSKYRDLQVDLGEVAETARLKTNKGPSAFLDSLENIPSEKVKDKFFNVDNNRQLSNLKQKFPEEFELLRQGKIKEFAQSALDNSGSTSSSKLLRELKNLSPESKQMIFGSNTNVISDLETVQRSLPRNFNPSGTASQAGWQDILMSNVKDIPTYMTYRAASGNLAKSLKTAAGKVDQVPKLSEAYTKTSNPINRAAITAMESRKISTPRMLQLEKAEKDEKEESAPPMPTKGPEKWANEGAKKIQNIDSSIDIEKIKNSKKGKQLLIQASDLKADSKAMKNVIAQLRNLKGAD